MSLLWIEGFETFGAIGSNITALLVKKYGVPLDVSAGGCELCAGRFFGSAARLRTTSPALCFSTPAFTPTATVIVGCAIKVDSISSPTDLLRFYDGDALYHVGVQIVNSGVIRLNRNGTTMPGESAPNTVAAGQWYYLEIKVTVGDTDGSYEVRVNGVTVASASGIDTRNGGTGLIERVQFRGWQASTVSVFATYDDMYVLNSLGTDNNSFLGSQLVESVFPNTNVQNGWIPSVGSNNAACVDENPSNDDTDFVYSAVSGSKDLYGVGSCTHINGNIKGVQLNVDARVTDSTPQGLRPLVKAGGVETPGGSTTVTSTGYKVFPIVAEHNPSTGALWTPAEIAAMQIGIEHV
jgi:hypothetical protein